MNQEEEKVKDTTMVTNIWVCKGTLKTKKNERMDLNFLFNCQPN